MGQMPNTIAAMMNQPSPLSTHLAYLGLTHSELLLERLGFLQFPLRLSLHWAATP